MTKNVWQDCSTEAAGAYWDGMMAKKHETWGKTYSYMVKLKHV